VSQQAVLVGVIVLSSALTAGCAAVALVPLVTAVFGGAASVGVSHTIDGIAFRTFSASLEETRRAAKAALKHMNIPVSKDEKSGNGRKIEAAAGDRNIFIDLERLTSRATRMRVTAKYAVFLRDRSASGEIILQTESALTGVPVKRKDKPGGLPVPPGPPPVAPTPRSPFGSHDSN
jgi:hypothetical protein